MKYSFEKVKLNSKQVSIEKYPEVITWNSDYRHHNRPELRSDIPKAHQSDGPLVRRLAVPKSRLIRKTNLNADHTIFVFITEVLVKTKNNSNEKRSAPIGTAI